MPDIALIVKFTAKEGESEALGGALSDLLAPTRLEEGCLRYDLFRGDDGSYVMVEEWRDAMSLDRHVQTPHVRAAIKLFDKVLGAPPRVEQYSPVTLAPRG